MPTPAADVETLMGTVQRLTVPMETLAAVGAHLRAEADELEVDPRVATLLADVAREAGVPPDASPEAKRAALGYIRAFFRLAGDLLEDPARTPGWTHEDPVVLQSVGRGSSALAGVIAAAAAELGDLQQRLRTPGAAILDVGSGTGWLAMALAETYPEAHVVGIDVWQPAIALARRNVVAARLEERVELRQQDATRLADTDSYDLVWIACPFLPEHVLLRAAEKARAALRPGGWMVLGIFAGPDDPLATRLSDLRTIRSGGHPWTTEELVALATAAGLADAHEVARTWNTPARLVVARRD